MLDVTEKGRLEAERLRPQRVENYRVKHDVDFKCQHEGCEVDYSILVVRLDGELTTRCQKHLKGEVMPGQWNSR